VRRPFLRKVLSTTLPLREIPLINVNLLAGVPRGILCTRQAVRRFRSKISAHEDPCGEPLSWFSIYTVREAEPTFEVHATKRGYVSLTPLRLDLTDDDALKRMSKVQYR
jgi:5'-nucleotidase